MLILEKVFKRQESAGISLVVQWLRLHAPSVGGPGWMPPQGTRSHVPQLIVCVPQLKISSCCLVAKVVQLFCYPHGLLPGSSVCGIFQARMGRVAISFSRGSSQPGNQTRVSCIDWQILYHWATRKAQVKKKKSYGLKKKRSCMSQWRFLHAATKPGHSQVSKILKINILKRQDWTKIQLLGMWGAKNSGNLCWIQKCWVKN